MRPRDAGAVRMLCACFGMGRKGIHVNRVYSLKKNREFQYVYRAGKPRSDGYMVLLGVKARHGGIRVGFSISKKVGNSVVRNRVKRRLRECFRAKIPRVKPGFSFVFVARPSAAQAPYQALDRSMESLLRRSDFLKGMQP